MATVTLPVVPSGISSTVAGYPQLRNQAGYVYFEGWAGAGSQATPYEFGLQYYPLNPNCNNQPKKVDCGNNYAVYARGPKLWWNPAGGIRISAGDTIQLTMSAYQYTQPKTAKWPAVAGCNNVKACLVVSAHDLTTGKVYQQAFNAQGWHGNSMTFARMTTIAQDMYAPYAGNIFNDGAVFGPIQWSNAALGQETTNGIRTLPWSGGGVQSWPADGTRIIVTNLSGEVGETDKINLHP
jgi:hypothetical protein